MENFIEYLTHFHKKCHLPHLCARPSVFPFMAWSHQGSLSSWVLHHNLPYGYPSARHTWPAHSILLLRTNWHILGLLKSLCISSFFRISLNSHYTLAHILSSEFSFRSLRDFLHLLLYLSMFHVHMLLWGANM